MPITRVELPQVETQSRPIQIIQKVIEPVILSARKFYHSDPERFLEFFGLIVLSLLTLVNKWIVIGLCLYILGYFNFLPRFKKFIKRKKKSG